MRWAVLAAAALAAGCGGQAPPPARGGKLELVGVPDRTEVPVGEVVRITCTLTNTGPGIQRIHRLDYDDKAIDMKVTFRRRDHATSRLLDGGTGDEDLGVGESRTAVLEFPAIRTGTYTIEPHYHGPPDHAHAAPFDVKVVPVTVDGVRKDRLVAVLETEAGRIELKLDVVADFGAVYNFWRRATRKGYDGMVLTRTAEPGYAAVVANRPRGGDPERPYRIPYVLADREPPPPGAVGLGLPLKASQVLNRPLADGHALFFVRETPDADEVPTNPLVGRVIGGQHVLGSLDRGRAELVVKTVRFRPF